MARQCDSDWLFLIERDEQLSPGWHQQGWRAFLEDKRFTHYLIPRRWTIPGDRYITSAPWWPDFHLRLFRSGVEGTTFPKRLHDTMHVPGIGRTFRTISIYHHILWLCPREIREQRVAYYERLRAQLSWRTTISTRITPPRPRACRLK